jgi:hypothetical protein
LSARSRAFLAHLIALAKPQSVLEIGSYFAGSSEVLARALLAAGQGQLITIDPEDHRAEICRDRIAEWPAEIRDLTAFIQITSKDLFDGLSANANVRFGLSFIDGDHTYAAALTDLIGCARYADDDSVIVVDDFDQAQVNWAVRDFLRLHPGWRELGGAFDDNAGDDPFEGMRPSLPGLPFLILVGPAAAGLELTTSGAHDGGALFAKFNLDSVHPQGLDALRHTARLEVAPGCEKLQFSFDPPLSTAGAQKAASNACEVALIWRSPGPALSLRAAPVWKFTG